jgi:hypothetical protein
VTDENMVDSAVANLKPHQLNLGCFTTIYQKKGLVVVDQLGSLMSAKSKRGRITAQYFNVESQNQLS